MRLSAHLISTNAIWVSIGGAVDAFAGYLGIVKAIDGDPGGHFYSKTAETICDTNENANDLSNGRMQ